MVANKVIVRSRKAGDEKGWLWASDGRSGYTISEADTPACSVGPAISLQLKDDCKEFLSEWRIREIVRRYSDHIAFPIMLEVKPKAGDTKTKEKITRADQ